MSSRVLWIFGSFRGRRPGSARAGAVFRSEPVFAAGLWVLAGLLGPTPTRGQEQGDEPPELTALPVTDGAIDVDGRLLEDAWATPEFASRFTQREPDDGSPASERTEVRVLYSSTALYVGVRAFDSEPDEIRAQLVRRDGVPRSDYVRVFLDSYHDRRSSFEFALTPAGAIRDASQADDSPWGDTSWDPVWEGRAATDSLGWSAEFRIPFTQLRFDRRNVAWGLQVSRRIERKAEEVWWAPYSKEGSGFASRFGVVRGLEGLPSPKRLEVQPYAVTSTRRRPASNGSLYAPESQTAFDAGVDLKYGVTSDFTLDLTINPDFGQVEADPAVVNLTAFESFFPERRPFFTEGGSLFNRFVPAGQLFYSRRIGRPPQGFAVPPEGGTVEIPDGSTVLSAAKITGKTAGGTGLGVMSALTAGEKAVLRDAAGAVIGTAPVEPRVHHFAGRVEQDFRKGSHTVGGMVTAVNRSLVDELDFLRSGAYVGEADGRHRWRGNRYSVNWSVATSRIVGTEGSILSAQRSAFRYYQRPDAGHLELDPSRTSLSGYALSVEGGKESGTWRARSRYMRVSPGFDISDMGFQWGADRQDFGLNGAYHLLRPRGRFRNLVLSTDATRSSTTGGETLENWVRPLLAQVTFTNNWSLTLNPLAVRWDRRSVTALRGGPSLRENDWHNSFLSLTTDRRKTVSATLWASAGGVFGTPERFGSFQPRVDFRPGGSLNASLAVNYAWNRDPTQWVAGRTVEDSTHYVLGTVDRKTVNVTSRVDWTFSPTTSLQLYAQPFVSAGAYDDLKGVADPHASTFEGRFRAYGDQLTCETETCHVDLNSDGGGDFSFRRPDFNFKSLRATMVLRWEYRPGSVLYVAWQHSRSEIERHGSLRGMSELGELFSLESDNIVLIKANYWLAF